MKLIVISNPINFKEEISSVIDLFESGLEYFHLRKPDSNESEILDFINSIPNEFHSRIILHNHFRLIDKFNLKGIHFSLRFPSEKFFLNNSIVHQSASFHNIKEIKQCNFNLDYVFLSPIFDSISKANYNSRFDLVELEHEISEVKTDKSKPKIIALGGIDETRIRAVQKAGFDGIAILGTLWNRQHSRNERINTFNKIQTNLKKLTYDFTSK